MTTGCDWGLDRAGHSGLAGGWRRRSVPWRLLPEPVEQSHGASSTRCRVALVQHVKPGMTDPRRTSSRPTTLWGHAARFVRGRSVLQRRAQPRAARLRGAETTPRRRMATSSHCWPVLPEAHSSGVSAASLFSIQHPWTPATWCSTCSVSCSLASTPWMRMANRVGLPRDSRFAPARDRAQERMTTTWSIAINAEGEPHG